MEHSLLDLLAILSLQHAPLSLVAVAMPVLLLALSLWSPSDPPCGLRQDPSAEVEQADEVQLAVEYERLQSQYSNDKGNWAAEEKRLRGAGVPEARRPEHPGFEYQGLFEGLAERGSPDARLWMVQNSAFHGEAKVVRRRVLQRWYLALVQDNADAEFMAEVIEELAGSRRLLGEEFILATLTELCDRTKNSDFIVAALYHRAWLLSERMRTTDEERRAEAMELFAVIVSAYPDSKEAAMAAGVVYSVESKALRLALHAWCEACRVQLADGKGPADWPVNPMHQFQPRMVVLAGAGSGQAQQWTQQFYPAFDQRDRRARDLGTLWLGQEFSKRRSSSERKWMDLKFDILDLACEVSSEADWAFDLVKGLDDEVSFFLPGRYAPILRKVIDTAADSRVREQAQLTLARALAKGAVFAELNEAVSIFRALELDAGVERIGKEAEEYLESLERVMPGALAPKLVGQDGEGLEFDLANYRGKVVVLWFWSFTRQVDSQIAAIQALRERLKDEDFVFLGVNCDLASPISFQRRAVREGITWRNLLQFRPTGHLTHAYGVHHWPTSFIVDAEGVMRGRSIELVAAEELVRSLLSAPK